MSVEVSERFSTSVILGLTVESIENITLTSDISTEAGSPGDTIYYRIKVLNEGNIIRNVTMIMGGETESGSLTARVLTVHPGITIERFLVIKIPNKRAGTVIRHELFGVVSQVGITETLRFTTVVRPISKIEGRITHSTLLLTNNGNVPEKISVKIEIEDGPRNAKLHSSTE